MQSAGKKWQEELEKNFSRKIKRAGSLPPVLLLMTDDFPRSHQIEEQHFRILDAGEFERLLL